MSIAILRMLILGIRGSWSGRLRPPEQGNQNSLRFLKVSDDLAALRVFSELVNLGP